MSKDKDTPDLAAQSRKIWDEGAELMWHNIFAETVLEILASDGQITRASLRARLEARSDADGTDRITRATLRGALNALDGRPPLA